MSGFEEGRKRNTPRAMKPREMLPGTRIWNQSTLGFSTTLSAGSSGS